MWPFIAEEDIQEEIREREVKSLPSKIRDLEKRLESTSKVKECALRSHKPHEQKVIDPYRPEKLGITVSCSNCNYIYERSPTAEEIRLYNS